MRQKILIGLGVVILLLVVAGYFFWRSMSEPFYKPGMVRAEKNLRGSLEPPRQTGDSPSWLVEDDIRLYYHSQGAGRPILVIHGGPGFPIHDSLPGLAPLAKDFKFYYYDQRGCGKSTRPFDRFASSNYYTNMKRLEQTLGIGAQVADIERIRRILGQDQLILMGHSFGGFLAALYAAEFPEHVEALVLVAPAGVLVLPAADNGFFGQIRQRLPGDQQEEFDILLQEYLDFGSIFSRSEKELADLNRRLGKFFVDASRPRGEAAANEPPVDSGGWMVQAMYLSMGKRHDYREALGKVRAPSLIIHGEDDLVPVEVSRMYAECLPNSRLQVIKSGRTPCGHFPFREQPEEFAAVVGNFLREKSK